ncbi:MAG: HNH nuclease family protein [Vicinamibacteria bacterium]|nr:HNH nuclease family protein [Vicinamibacteria bacterium]
MRFRGHGHRRLRPPPPDSKASVDALIDEIRRARLAPDNYRERSLKIHGLVCAKCGRDFSHHDRRLLTVHHKDGNHSNNPPDGSNWENLCVYCHEDEHGRGLTGFDSEEK